MSSGSTFVVDFVVKDSPDRWKMILVEEGPWVGPLDDHLRRIQDRMYECVDAVLDGKLADRFPESKGAHISVELECFNVPRAEVESFVERFASKVPVLDDYHRTLQDSPYTSGISFRANFGDAH